MKKELLEGIKFNTKIKDEVLNDPNIMCGVEFEFLAHDMTHFMELEEMSTTEMLYQCTENYNSPQSYDVIDSTEVPVYMFEIDGVEYIYNNDDRDSNGDTVVVGLNSASTFLEFTSKHTLDYNWDEIFSEEIKTALYKFAEVERVSVDEDYFNALEVIYLQGELQDYVDEFHVIQNLVDVMGLPYLVDAMELLLEIENSRLNGEPSEDAIELISELDMGEVIKELKEKPKFDKSKANYTLATSYQEPIDDDEITSEDFDFSEITDELDNIGVRYETVELDHNSIISPIEIIGLKQPLSDANGDIARVQRMIQDSEMFYTDESCGMHVSISYKDGNEQFNINKFITLLNAKKISNEFALRRHITDLHEDIMRSMLFRVKLALQAVRNETIDVVLEELKHQSDMRNVVKDVYADNIALVDDNEKYQAVNIRDYHYRNGRIELRYFGGDAGIGGDEYEYKDMENEILRAAYMLRISHSDDYDREYRKALVKLGNDARKAVLMLIDAIKKRDMAKIRMLSNHYEAFRMGNDFYENLIEGGE